MTGLRGVRIPTWQRDAACAEIGGDWWFPELHAVIPPAVLRTCAGCPVRRDCLTFALDGGEEFGIWAGITGPELPGLRQRISGGWPEHLVLDTALLEAFTRAELGASIYHGAAPELITIRIHDQPAPDPTLHDEEDDGLEAEVIYGLGNAPEPTAAELAAAEALFQSVRRSA